MAAKEDIRAQVIQIIGEELSHDPDKITDQTTIMGDLGADSLDITELMLKFEDKFDIEIPEEEAQNIQSVGDAVRYLTQMVESRSAKK